MPKALRGDLPLVPLAVQIIVNFEIISGLENKKTHPFE
jgi:hypothetical protein